MMQNNQDTRNQGLSDRVFPAVLCAEYTDVDEGSRFIIKVKLAPVIRRNKQEELPLYE